MKIVCITDTHNKHKYLTSKAYGDLLPHGDLLCHCGDLTNLGKKGEVEDIFKWFESIVDRYTYGIVFICGNHDKTFDPKFGDYQIDDVNGELPKIKPYWLKQMINNLPGNIHYLENSDITINGLKIWGSPVSPWFHGDRWGFNKYRGDEIDEVWKQIPLDTDIIMTHTPVSYKLDYLPDQNEYLGCEQLRYRVKEIKPLVHMCGHIHPGRNVDYDENTTYVNACILDDGHNFVNKPIVIEVNKEEREVKIL